MRAVSSSLHLFISGSLSIYTEVTLQHENPIASSKEQRGLWRPGLPRMEELRGQVEMSGVTGALGFLLQGQAGLTALQRNEEQSPGKEDPQVSRLA